MKNDAFASFHPAVNFLYFAVVIGFAMFLTHPVFLGISLVCSLAYAIYLNGKKFLRLGIFLLPMLILTVILNPLFNRAGDTILLYLPNGNPITLEATVYGIAAAVMLITVISWFSCFNAVITSDKLICLFGRIIPASSLILSMSLRFVPRFLAQMKIVSNAQKCIGHGVSIRQGVKIISIMITWSLENAIETADSMKSRGYGLPGRTAFSIFRFDKRDAFAIAFIVACAAIIFTSAWFVFYFALCAFPLIVNAKEGLHWKLTASKI
jgi:energy-coupling factor transport system permease protein